MRDAVEMTSHWERGDVLIFSDSFSALTSVATISWGVRTNHLILDLKRMLYKLGQDHGGPFYSQFYWVPAHVGIRGHECADLLAKEAAAGEPDYSAKCRLVNIFLPKQIAPIIII